MQYIDFEAPIADLEKRIEELRKMHSSEVDLSNEIKALEFKCQELTKDIFTNLTDWDVVRIARHPSRPYTMDYIDRVFNDFQELHGDRVFADDPSIIAGIATLDGRSVMIIGHQKGKNTKDKLFRNFGMPKPEGYRKAKRLMCLAEKFNLPIITFIDTPGAYPGMDAEERNQSEAIASNLYLMSALKVPIISVVIGEGGSGGALAIGVADLVLMLQYSVYSVISPEGCASILWRDAAKAKDAANAMVMRADRLMDFGLIDGVIDEPLGGAHRDYDAMASELKSVLCKHIANLSRLSIDTLLTKRYEKLTNYGK